MVTQIIRCAFYSDQELQDQITLSCGRPFNHQILDGNLYTAHSLHTKVGIGNLALAAQGSAQPLEKVGVRRLLLEHTYVQLNENNMHNALLSYQMALRLPHYFGDREKELLKRAGIINQLRFNQSSFAAELGDLHVSSPP